MAELNETPRGNRIHIAFFGLRNAGKSTLVNAFTGQRLAIVSDVPGTTTDPVSKAMEILPLGPCLVTDTAGLDDEGALGKMRVEKTLKVLETTDIAVWVEGVKEEVKSKSEEVWRERFLSACQAGRVTVLEYQRGDSVESLKKKIAAIKLEDQIPGLLDGLVQKDDRVVCVVPIDESAPKGRLILPQQQVIRECLDRHLACTVCQPGELFDCLSCLGCLSLTDADRSTLVITDSQVFGVVSATIDKFKQLKQSTQPKQSLRLTSFSILFARQKGDIAEYAKGLKALQTLKDGDTVLVAEGCTHHRQCNDIGSVKIPKALAKLSGRNLNFTFSSGTDFGLQKKCSNAAVRLHLSPSPSLIVHCGGCMLTRREVLRRIGLAKDAGIPIVNYGLLLAMANGLSIEDVML